MEEVANAVLQNFHSGESTSSQSVCHDVATDLRREYLDSLENDTKQSAFLERLANALQGSNLCLSGADYTLSVAYSHPHLDEEVHDDVVFESKYQSVGRHGDIRIHNGYQAVSRIHAVLFVVTGNNGKCMLVVLDFWSLFGTAIGGTHHCSLPDDRRVLIVPTDRPVVLQLGVLHEPSLSLVLNAPKCVVCLSNSRTEVFETCGHLATCKACLVKMMQDTSVAECPICRTSVSAQTTRPAQYALGECQTYVGGFNTNRTTLEDDMDDLQTTICRAPQG